MTTTNMTKLTRRKLKSPRLLLILSTLAIFATSVATIVALALGGYDFVHYVFPSVMILADVAFLILSLFTNYRFRYAIPIPLIYLGVSAILTAITVLLDGGTGGTDVFTHFAFYSFIVVHLLAVLTVVFAYMHAAGVGKKPAGMRNTTAIAFLLLVATVSVYSYSMLINGWFGQGAIGVERTLEYSYNESDNTYTVSGVLNGRGDTIVVPAEFNGIKVKSVDCSIFDTPMVTKVYLNCDIDTELTNPELLYNESQPRTVFVKEYQHYGEMFLKKAYNEENAHFIGLVNQMQPSNIEEGKVYVTFTYSYDDLLAVGGNVLPMWVGNAGDRISADDFAADFDYIAHPYDATDADNFSENKLWAYENINKRIFKGVSCFGTNVNESIDHVTVDFETLYMVTVDEDNDEEYLIPEDFRYADVSVAESSHIFAYSEVDSWLKTFDERPGFDYVWKYNNEEDSTANFTTLSEVLYDGIAIRPEWTMKAPTITECKLDDASLIYGETAKFLSSAIPAYMDFELEFFWEFLDGEQTDEENEERRFANWDLLKSHPNHSGTYRLTVTSKVEGSSIKATATASIDLTVNKRPVDIIWGTLGSGDYTNFYTANNQEVIWALDTDDIYVDDLEGENALALISTSSAIKDATSYTFSAELSNLTDCYVITEATKSQTYTINPAPVTVIWNFEEGGYTYSGYKQAPTATAVGLGDDGTLVLTVKNAAKDAGEGHVVTASADDYNNYVAEYNTTAEYDIAPYPIDVQWDSTTLELVFNGKAQKPSASIQGLALDGTIALDVAGEMTNAGEGDDYVATASTKNGNYLLKSDYLTTSFKITPMPVEVKWTDLSLVYNGAKQLPTASATGALGAKVALIVSCDENSTDYRELVYNASVITEDTNYTLSNTETEFNITKREITISWTNTSFTYSGEGQKPTATIKNAVEGEVLELEYTFFDANKEDIGVIVPENAASYTIKAILAVSNSVNNNYTIKETSAEKAYTIAKKTVDAIWPTETSFVYDKTAHIITATALGVDGETPIAITTTGEQTNVGTYYATAASDDSNYQIKASTANQKFTITPKEVEVIWENLEFTYNGSSQIPTATAAVIDGDNANIVTVTGGKTNANTGDSTYTATATKNNASGASNYTLKADTTTTAFKILPYTASVTWNLNVTYNGYAQAPTATVKGPKNEDVKIVITGDGEFAGSGYSASAALDTTKNNSNYYYTNYVLSNETTDYSISPKSIGLTNNNWGTTTFTYDGTAHAPTASFDGIGDDGTIQLHIDGAQVNYGQYSGEYAATASLIEGDYAGSYTFSGITSKGFGIEKATLKLNWENTTFNYDRTSHLPGVSILSGLIDGDSVDVAVSSSAQINAGTHTATAVISGDDVNNYKIADSDASYSFKINQAVVTLSWSNIEFDYTGTSHVPNVTIKSGKIDGDSLTVAVTSSSAQTNAGTHTAEATLSGTSRSNYIIDENDLKQEFEINKAVVRLDWYNTIFTYDGTTHVPNVTIISGKISGDSLTVAVDNTSAKTDAGTYTAKAVLSGNSKGNYEIHEDDREKEFIINKATIELAWTNTTKEYTGGQLKPSVSILSGKISGDSLSVSCSSASEAGTHTITATLSGTDKDNYVISNPTVSFTITEAVEND